MITTADGIDLELSIGQIITSSEECDLIGKTFSDGRVSGVVQRVEMTYMDGILEPKLWLGQNYLNAWNAFQACRWCHEPMEWVRLETNLWNGEPPVVDVVYRCTECGNADEQAVGNVPEDNYELPI